MAGSTSHPSAPAQDRPAGVPPRRHGGGNWRSLVFSTLIILGVVALWMALAPRPARVPQRAVDVTAVAREAHRQGYEVPVPGIGEPWKPTSVSFEDSAQGPRAWHVGYQNTQDDSLYVAVEQARHTASAQADQAWLKAVTKDGGEAGESRVDGRTWKRIEAPGDATRRSLVSRRDRDTVVVTGLADFATLEQVAASLRPFQG